MPLIVKWPGTIKPGSKFNDMISHEDWMPTFAAAVGGDSVAGITNGPPFAYTFGTTFSSAPDVALTTMAGVDGVNGGWAQTHGTPQTTTTQIFMSIDEDTIGDTERSHTTEQVAYFVSETPISVP